MRSLLFLFSFFISLSVFFQESHPYIPETDSLVLEKLEQWKDLKFGLLMHWGPYSQWGVVESWSLCSEDEPWCKRKMKNYMDYCRAYETLKTTSNPDGTIYVIFLAGEKETTMPVSVYIDGFQPARRSTPPGVNTRRAIMHGRSGFVDRSGNLRFFSGQREEKRASFSGVAFSPDTATVLLNEFPAQFQPQSAALPHT